jgi:histidyl-tRNA synthetase
MDKQDNIGEILAFLGGIDEVRVECDLKATKLKKFLNQSSNRNTRVAGYLGEAELVAGTILLKHMTTGNQTHVRRELWKL